MCFIDCIRRFFLSTDSDILIFHDSTETIKWLPTSFHIPVLEEIRNSRFKSIKSWHLNRYSVFFCLDKIKNNTGFMNARIWRVYKNIHMGKKLGNNAEMEFYQLHW